MGYISNFRNHKKPLKLTHNREISDEKRQLIEKDQEREERIRDLEIVEVQYLALLEVKYLTDDRNKYKHANYFKLGRRLLKSLRNSHKEKRILEGEVKQLEAVKLLNMVTRLVMEKVSYNLNTRAVQTMNMNHVTSVNRILSALSESDSFMLIVFQEE